MLYHFVKIAVVLTVLLSSLTSCAGGAEKISSSWTPEMFFKHAQEALDQNRYKDALSYYEVFLIRYPENYQKRIAIDYERAFISYKTGELDAAETGFQEILQKYEESPYAMLFPPRFKRLCTIGLQNIERKKAVNNKLFWRVKEKAWAEEHNKSVVDEQETDLLEN